MKYRLDSVRDSEGGVFERLRLRPFIVGVGNGGRIGDDPPSAVELEEKAGDPGTTLSSGSGVAGTMSTRATATGREAGEDEVGIIARVGGRGQLLGFRCRGVDFEELTWSYETSANDVEVVCNCVSHKPQAV